MRILKWLVGASFFGVILSIWLTSNSVAAGVYGLVGSTLIFGPSIMILVTAKLMMLGVRQVDLRQSGG